MSLRKFTRVNGSIEVNSIVLNLDFEVVNNVPGIISFNFSNNGTYVSGSYSTKLDYYSVNGEILPSEIMSEVVTALENVKTNYEDYLE
jgi:hypothetical protein